MVSYTFTLVTTKILKNIVVKFEFFICHAWSKGAKLLSQQVISFGLQVIIHHFLDICNTCGLLDYPNWDSVCISQINPNVIVVRRSYPILKARPSGPKVSKTNPMGPVWVLGLKKRLSTQGIPNPKVTHGANRMTVDWNGLYIDIVLGKNDQKGPLVGLKFKTLKR